MTLELTVPLPGGEYRRGFDAEIDIVDKGQIFVRGGMRDHRFDLEHTWLLTTPEYEVLEAGAIQHAGRADHVSPHLCPRYAAIKGVRIGRGFSKRILDALGEDLPGKQEHLLLAIEMARVGQQIYQFPAGCKLAANTRTLTQSDANAMSIWPRAVRQGLHTPSCPH